MKAEVWATRPLSILLLSHSCLRPQTEADLQQSLHTNSSIGVCENSWPPLHCLRSFSNKARVTPVVTGIMVYAQKVFMENKM